MHAQRERLTVYQLMGDDQLEHAIRELEAKICQLSATQTQVARRLRDSYFDALSQAQLEQARRRC